VLGVPARGRDVRLEPPVALLLRLVGELQALLRARLGVAIGAVAALVRGQRAALELEDPGDRVVEEPPVVRDHQHLAGEAEQECLQPGQAVEVEVVGRLVEQQHGRAGEQHAGQQRPRRLAAAEPAERRVERDVRDAERRPRAVELGLQRPAAERAVALLRLAVRGQRGRVAEPALQPRELVVQLPHLAERGAQQPVDRQLRAWRLLRQIADPVARAERDAAALWTTDAREEP
jgi:hypothetical protein